MVHPSTEMEASLRAAAVAAPIAMPIAAPITTRVATALTARMATIFATRASTVVATPVAARVSTPAVLEAHTQEPVAAPAAVTVAAVTSPDVEAADCSVAEADDCAGAPSRVPEPGANSDTPDDATCVVCMDMPRKYLAVPCFHWCLCHRCVELLKTKQATRCPVCRAEVSDWKRVYN